MRGQGPHPCSPHLVGLNEGLCVCAKLQNRIHALPHYWDFSFTSTSQFPSSSVLLRLILQAPYRVMAKVLRPKVPQEGGFQHPWTSSAHEGTGDGKSCSATVQILEFPALVGILEEAAGLAPLARGCALGGASSHIPARGFSPLPVAQAHTGRTCCAAGMCRGDTAELPAVTQAMPRSR